MVSVLARYRERRYRKFMERRTRQVIELLRPDRERILRSAFVDASLDAMKETPESIFDGWPCKHQLEIVRERWHLWTDEGRSDDWIYRYIAAFRDVPRCPVGCRDAKEVYR